MNVLNPLGHSFAIRLPQNNIRGQEVDGAWTLFTDAYCLPRVARGKNRLAAFVLKDNAEHA
jgi:hypothetical protein